MRTLLLLSLLCWLGCAPAQGLSLNLGFALDVGLIGDEGTRHNAVQAITDGLHQLGSSVRDSADQKIIVDFDPQCSCGSCNKTTGGYWDSKRPQYLTLCNQTAFKTITLWVVAHELGHSLARRLGHLSCDKASVMSPDMVCNQVSEYTPQDIAYICQGAEGGVCDS
jgi:hypothetical protein